MTVTPLMLLLVLANLVCIVLNCFRAGEMHKDPETEISNLVIAAIIINFIVLLSFIMMVSMTITG